MTVESGADVSLVVPDIPPTGPSTSGGSGGGRQLSGTGKLFLTDQRVRPFETRALSEENSRRARTLSLYSSPRTTAATQASIP